MKSLDKFLTHAMHGVIVVSLALMVVMVFGNVVLRYLFNSGITASEELARFFFLWLIFVGSVVGFVYFRYGMPAFRKMGVSIDPQATPPRKTEDAKGK